MTIAITFIALYLIVVIINAYIECEMPKAKGFPDMIHPEQSVYDALDWIPNYKVHSPVPYFQSQRKDVRIDKWGTSDSYYDELFSREHYGKNWRTHHGMINLYRTKGVWFKKNGNPMPMSGLEYFSAYMSKID